MVIAKEMLGIGIGASRIRVPIHQVVVIHADDQHDQAADRDAQHRSQGACHRQEGGSGHDKGAPAHAAAKGQRPRSQGRQVAEESLPPRFLRWIQPDHLPFRYSTIAGGSSFRVAASLHVIIGIWRHERRRYSPVKRRLRTPRCPSRYSVSASIKPPPSRAPRHRRASWDCRIGIPR